MHEAPVKAPDERDGTRSYVPMSLRSADGSRHLLRSAELVVVNGTVQPVEFGGRRYAFLHTVVSNGYGAEGELVYIFAETDCY